MKVAAVGLLLTLIWALNWFSVTYALVLVFQPGMAPGAVGMFTGLSLCTGFGFAWSVIVLNLFRFLTASVGHGDGTQSLSGSELLMLGVQWTLSALIGLCLTVPVSIMIARSDLQSQISDSQERALTSLTREVDSSFRRQLSDLYLDKAEAAEALTLALERVQNLRRLTQAMVNGQASKAQSNDLADGDASVTRAAREVQLIRERVDSISAEIARVRDEINEKKETARALIARSNSLWTEAGRIWRHAPPLFFGIALILVLLHAGPYLIRAFSAKGTYEHLVEVQNELTCAKFGIARDAIEVSEPDGPGRFIERRFDRFLVAELLAERCDESLQVSARAWRNTLINHAQAARRRLTAS